VTADDSMPPASLLNAAGSLRPTRAMIDLGALANHVRIIATLVAPASMMAVVKANAYGHGAAMVARTALLNGASSLAVATVDEGIALRDDGIAANILVLGPVLPGELPVALKDHLQLTAIDPTMSHAAGALARQLDLSWRPQFHVKIDSGMHRFGTDIATAVATAKSINADPFLELVGVSTHFAAAEEATRDVTHQQAAIFTRFLDELAMAGINPGIRHVANSAATLRFPTMHLDMVRVGLAMYGLNPSPHCVLPDSFRPILRIISRVARIHTLLPGDRVGYGGTFTATCPSQAALIPMGYADGYHRSLSSNAWMAIAGQRAPVLGRISMDQTVIGVAADASIGDEVTVMGDGNHGEPTIDEIAVMAGTNAYEIMCGLSGRLPRVYIRDGRMVALQRPWHTGVHEEAGRTRASTKKGQPIARWPEDP
jgi:alanine racemase